MAGGAQRAMTSREWSLLLLLSLLWGGSFFCVGVAVKELPPLTIVALRVALAAAILWALTPLTGARRPTNADAFKALAVVGLVRAGPSLRLAALAGCASMGKDATDSTGPGIGGRGPVILGVRGLEGPRPQILLPRDEAMDMGVFQPQPATPGLVDRLLASCGDASRQVDCKRIAQVCRFKTCEVVPSALP